jgi:hypothetical protein
MKASNPSAGQTEDNKPSLSAYHECPNFDSCSVNACPLASEDYESLPDDPETECTAMLSTRQRIAAKYGLSNQGKTKKELISVARSERAKAQWAGLSSAERKCRTAGLRATKQAI